MPLQLARRRQPRSLLFVVFYTYCFLLHPFLSVTPVHLHVHVVQAAKQDWYSRYTIYHPYCSVPSEMDKRSIPPVQKVNRLLGDTRLVHATTIIRHGARTPYAGSDSYQCWNGFWDSPQTGVWDCDLTTFSAPPTPLAIEEKVGTNSNNNMFLFEKKYDAQRTGNILNGTCQLGQLLLQGYEQELANGRHLRKAYLYDGQDTNFNHDISMRLIDLAPDSASPPFSEPFLKYRADDYQRTLMSGQVLLRGLFGEEFLHYANSFDTNIQTNKNKNHRENNKYSPPIIPLHTMDRTQDILTVNSQLCPRVRELTQEALTSEEYKSRFLTSKEGKTLQKFLANKLGLDLNLDNSIDLNNNDLADCLMTTMCTDRPLPEVVNDYKGPSQPIDNSNDDKNKGKNNYYGSNILERLYNWGLQPATFLFRYNNAAVSKLGMAPLWKEIMNNIHPIIHPDQQHGNTNRNKGHGTTRLALFSGHDTTIVPLMATLGERVWNRTDWPPYASMMIIEIHEIVDSVTTDRSVYKSDFAFRLLYNGNVMTRLIDNCPTGADLCDVTILENILDPILSSGASDCQATEEGNATANNQEETQLYLFRVLSNSGGVLLVVCSLVLSAALGSTVTFTYLTGRSPLVSGLASSSALHLGTKDGVSLIAKLSNDAEMPVRAVSHKIASID